MLKNASVQNWLGAKVTTYLSGQLNAKVSIKKLGFTLFNYVNLEGLYIEDQQKDTLLYAGQAQVKLTDWFFVKDTVQLSYISLDNTLININRTDSVWNYQFAINAFTQKKDPTTKSSTTKKAIQLHFKDVSLNNLSLRYHDSWQGSHTTAQVSNIVIKVNTLNLNENIVNIENVAIKDPKINYYTTLPLKPQSAKTTTVKSTVVTTAKSSTSNPNIYLKNIEITNGEAVYKTINATVTNNLFNPNNINITKLNTSLTNVSWRNDTISAGLKLSLAEQCGFVINSLSTTLMVTPNELTIKNLQLRTPNSTLKTNLAVNAPNLLQNTQNVLNTATITTRFTQSTLSSKDAGYFIPSLQKLNKNVYIDGDLKGTLANLTATNLSLKESTNTLQGNMTITGLPNINNTTVTLTNSTVNTSYNAISTYLPSIKNIKNIALNQLGNISYAGNAVVNNKAVTAIGTLSTALGIIVTNTALTLPNNTTPLLYNSTISTSGYNLGKLLPNNKLGMASFKADINNNGSKKNNAILNADATIKSIYYNNYTFTNLAGKANFVNKILTTTISANDPNATLNLNGTANFNNDLPQYNFNSEIGILNLKATNLIPTDDYSLSGNAYINASGTNLKNILGTVTLANARLTNYGKPLPLTFVNLQIAQNLLNRSIAIKTNEFEGKINGVFDLVTLPKSIGFFLSKYYPTYFKNYAKTNDNQVFTFELKTLNVSDFTKLLNSKIGGLNQANISGSVNTITNTLNLNGTIPYFAYGNAYKLNNLVLNANGNDSSFIVNATAENITINDSTTFTNTNIDVQSTNNLTNLRVYSNSNTSFNMLNINTNLVLFNNGVQANFLPSNFTLNKKVWDIEKNSELILRQDLIAINKFTISHLNQQVTLQSQPDDIGNYYNIYADVKDVELSDFTPLFLPKKIMEIEGQATGRIIIKDPLGKAYINTNEITITDFVKDKEYIGELKIKGNYNTTTNQATYSLLSNNLQYKFDVTGSYNPQDSTGNALRNNIKLNGTNIKIVEPFLDSNLVNLKGQVSGEIEIFGSSKQQYILGNIIIQEPVQFTIPYTNVPYTVQKGSIAFNARDIDFSTLTLKDTLNNTASINRGRIYHDGFFGSMNLDIDISTEKLLLLNTTRINNSLFYGNAISDAKLRIKGPTNALKIGVVVTNPADANITLNTNSNNKTLGKADFITFKTYGELINQGKPQLKDGGIDLDLNITSNTNAKIRVILDELLGDNISAKGTGNIKLKIPAKGDMTLNGLYTVEEGDYDFSLNSFIRKPFKIKKGSTINWTGDPLNANININAFYTANNVSLNDMVANQANGNLNNIKADLKVNAALTNTLTKPNIKFGIDYETENQKKDQNIDNLIERIRKDDNLLNQQVAFLVLFDRLLPINTALNASQGISSAVSIVANSFISGFMAQQATSVINKLLAQAFPNTNIKANLDINAYTPGLERSIAQRVSSNLGLQWDLLDNRTSFIFSSNFDFGLAGSQNAIQVLPNFVFEYKIKLDGSVVGTLFRRTGIDPIQANLNRSRRISNGVGIVWRKESENFLDLFFQRKKKTEPKKIPQAL